MWSRIGRYLGEQLGITMAKDFLCLTNTLYLGVLFRLWIFLYGIIIKERKDSNKLAQP